MASSPSPASLKDPPATGPSTSTPPSLKPKLPQPSVAPAVAATANATATASTSSPIKPEVPTPSSAAQRPPLVPPSSDADVVQIPSYSRWFSWDSIHETEVRFLPEFFDSRSPLKNPSVYMYYRNSIIKHFRKNPSGKITFTEVRKTLAGDVGSVRRVFDFLEGWGLINYSPSALNKPLKWEDKDNKSSSHGGGDLHDSTPPRRDSSRRLCSGCQSVCTIACFVCDKYDLTLCARCYVRGNYRVGVSCTDFRRVEISEEISTEWTEKETLQLLEAVTHYRDDWKKVALHVPGRSERDCVTHFLKLPFGEEFAGYTELGDPISKSGQIKSCSNSDSGLERTDSLSACKKIRLTPLADANNPIMSQAAFLSALAGTEVAQAAAQAAVKALTDIEGGASKGNLGSLSRTTRQPGAGIASNGDANQNASERASFNDNSLSDKEKLEAEKAISTIIEVQMKEIQDKIVHFEELDLLMEKEWQQLEQMKNLLFIDQLAVLFHKKSTPKTGGKLGENVRTD